MAWSWSHSAEGMQNVRDNIALLEDDDLIVIYAEWKACDAANRKQRLESAISEWDGEDEDDVTVGDLLRKYDAKNADDYDSNAFDNAAYERAEIEAKELIAKGIDVAKYIADRAEEHAICDNGGFNAWVCPSGCHTVSFSSADELNEVED